MPSRARSAGRRCVGPPTASVGARVARSLGRLLLPALFPLAAFAAEPSSAPNPRFTGSPFLSVWLAEDYGGSASNHCVLQHPRTGFIYVGNDAGLLEFDGERWQLIRHPGLARALAVDARDRLWAACGDTIVRFEPGPHGTLRPQSMVNRVPEQARVFHAAGRMVVGADGVFADGVNRVFFFGDDDGPARATYLPGDPASAQVQNMWWMNGALHVKMLIANHHHITRDALEVHVSGMQAPVAVSRDCVEDLLAHLNRGA